MSSFICLTTLCRVELSWLIKCCKFFMQTWWQITNTIIHKLKCKFPKLAITSLDVLQQSSLFILPFLRLQIMQIVISCPFAKGPATLKGVVKLWSICAVRTLPIVQIDSKSNHNPHANWDWWIYVFYAITLAIFKSKNGHWEKIA